MKKLLALILALAMALTLVACGGNDNNNDNENNDVNVENNGNNENNENADNNEDAENNDNAEDEVAEDEPLVDSVDPLELLNTVWGTYADEEKFAIAGGDYDNMTMDVPGTFNHENAEYLDSLLGVPADIVPNIESAASFMHMMNQNTFTCGAFNLKDDADVKAFIEALKTNIMNRQWMCGFPDTLVIMQINDTVISAFGNAELIENFKNKVNTSYTNVGVVVEESLA
ncbi:MAG: bacteriocin transport accessory protein [Oscillospiraceae bacterium]|nr:bacteriocin transport accessory protein [Oscillospiraceae bacterium]